MKRGRKATRRRDTPDSQASPGPLRRAAAKTASGLRRYPREIVASIRKTPTPLPLGPRGLLRGFEDLDLGAVWLGHASVLLRVGGAKGLTILTDPVFSPRVGLRVGRLTVGMPRLQALPVHPSDLPPVDLILLSHAHFDHLDRPTLQLLESPRTTVVTAAKTRRLVPKGFGQVIEMDWSHGLTLNAGRGKPALNLTAHRPQHYGARMAVDRRRGCNSYLIEQAGSASRPAKHRVFFAGDTADTRDFDGLGPIDLAIFGIGAYGGHWDHAHANPEQVWRMFQGLNRDDPDRGVLLPMHHSTFELGSEHRDEPLQRLLAAAGQQEYRVVGRDVGEIWKA